MNIVKEHFHEKSGRTYKLAETPLGNVWFYELGDDYIQYRDDIFWRILTKSEFEDRYGAPPVEIFASKRLTGFEKAVKVTSGHMTYHLARKKKYDGYIYEIPASELRAFTKKDHPDMQFVYTRYYEKALKALSHADLERLKIEAVWEFNGHSGYDVAGVGVIIDAVWKMEAK